MSFILDALKKSESDRQRQSGPALFEVKVAPPRSRLPPWALALAALLLVNLAIVGWMLWRHSPAHGAEAAAAADTPRTQSPAPAPPAAPATASAPAPPFSATITASATARPPPPAPSMDSSPAALPPAAPLTSPALTSPPAGGAGGTAEDNAPAVDPGAPGMLGGRVRRGTADGVPLYQEAAATAGVNLPPLRLDLHVFAARPQDRFVMINMHKVHEGDTLPEGVHIESITPEGALLSYNGTRFLLPRD